MERVSAFPTPPIDDPYANGLLAGADFAVVYTDGPEVRELMRWLASPDFGTETVARLPGYSPANRRFATDKTEPDSGTSPIASSSAHGVWTYDPL